MTQPAQARPFRVLDFGKIAETAIEQAKTIPGRTESVEIVFSQQKKGLSSITIKKTEEIQAPKGKHIRRLTFGQPYLSNRSYRAYSDDPAKNNQYFLSYLKGRENSCLKAMAQSKKNIAISLRDKIKAPENLSEGELLKVIRKLNHIITKAQKEGLLTLANEASTYEKELRSRLLALFQKNKAYSSKIVSPQRALAASTLVSFGIS